MNPCIFSTFNRRLDILINLIFLVGLQELQKVCPNIHLNLNELNLFCWLYVKGKVTVRLHQFILVAAI